MQQHLEIPFERFNISGVVEAIPLKLAYSKESDNAPDSKSPVVPSAQAVYGKNEEKNSMQSDSSNVWFIAMACISVLVVILLISYYIVNVLRTNGGSYKDFSEDEEYE